MFDISLMDRPPPEAAGEPACRSCTILLDPARPGRWAIHLPHSLGMVCESCYGTMKRFMSQGYTLPAALAACTWGTDL